MEPYIYFNEDEFNNDKKHTLRFGKEDEIQEVFFSPEKYYFITSMKSLVKLNDHIEE